MLILGVDVETTGLDPVNDKITEIAAVLFDTDTKQPVKFYCEYVQIEGEIPEVITDLTGITKDQLDTYGVSPIRAAGDWLLMVEMCDYIVAHNAPFDRSFLANFCTNLGCDPVNKPWIDTSVDIDYPETMKTRKLGYLAAEHKYIIHHAHRALFDVMAMLYILEQYDIEDVVALALEESVLLEAQCKKPWEDNAPIGEKDTDIAKANGFRFDGTTKTWRKYVKASQVDAAIKNKALSIRAIE